MATLSLRGASGRDYTFTLHSGSEQFGPYSGVYVAVKAITLTTVKVLYIGETNSFGRRVTQDMAAGIHAGLLCAEYNGMTHIGLMMQADERLRLDAETDLRNALNPPCNRQGLGLRVMGS